MSASQSKAPQKVKQVIAALVALGVMQVPLASLADAPAPWVQKADQKKKKKKKAVRRAPRRAVSQSQEVVQVPQEPAQVVEVAPQPAPVEVAPPVETPVAVAEPPVVTPPPVEPAAPAVASKGGAGWLLPVIGLVGLGGLVAALGSDSGG